MDEVQHKSDKSKWRLSREISLADIAVTTTVLIAAFTWGTSVENRFTKIETTIANAEQNSTAMKRTLERMDDKLDRLIERRGTP